MELFVPLRNYCERRADTLFAEPLNAISNIAFFIAAWAVYRAYKKHQLKDTRIVILIGLITLVGIGSTLFHTFANGLTMLMDVIPISIFVFVYLWFALRDLLGFSKIKTGVALLSFAFIASQTSQVPQEFRFNGSIDYFPCLAALLIISITLKFRRHLAANWIFMAAFCFVFSLFFRSIDFWTCPYLAVGTHFLWHSLNGLLLYLLTRAIFRVR